MAKHPIIVEGPDGSGKTTLAKNLCEHFGREYRRPSAEVLSSTHGPGGIELVYWWNDQLALPASKLANAIYDRCFYISDPIYQQAQVYRPLLIDGSDLIRGIVRLWNVEPVLVFCLPPFEVQLLNVKRFARERLQDVGDESLMKISNAYWAAFAVWSNALYDNVMTYNYTEEEAWRRLLNNLEAVG